MACIYEGKGQVKTRKLCKRLDEWIMGQELAWPSPTSCRPARGVAVQ